MTALGMMLVGATAAMADDVTGESLLLCAPGYVTHCSSGGVCETGPADNYGIPYFVRIDLDQERIMTSAASEDVSSTPIRSVTRAEGEIYLQGVENGRVFSVLIEEHTGLGALAIISNGETETAFIACTID
jgi:hypothetical protein